MARRLSDEIDRLLTDNERVPQSEVFEAVGDGLEIRRYLDDLERRGQVRRVVARGELIYVVRSETVGTDSE